MQEVETTASTRQRASEALAAIALCPHKWCEFVTYIFRSSPGPDVGIQLANGNGQTIGGQRV